MGGKKLLKKYDEVIDERHGQKSFQIGEDGKIDTTMVDIRRQMREDMAANAISLKWVFRNLSTSDFVSIRSCWFMFSKSVNFHWPLPSFKVLIEDYLFKL